MSESKYKIFDESYPHLITTGVYYGFPIFSNTEAVDFMLEYLLFLRYKRGIKLIAYVIIENHLSVILQGEDLAKNPGNYQGSRLCSVIHSADIRKK